MSQLFFLSKIVNVNRGMYKIAHVKCEIKLIEKFKITIKTYNFSLFRLIFNKKIGIIYLCSKCWNMHWKESYWTMKRVKETCRNIIIFIVAMGLCILPTLIFALILGTKEQIITGFRQPEYWVFTAFIAVIATWQYVKDINNSKK